MAPCAHVTPFAIIVYSLASLQLLIREGQQGDSFGQSFGLSRLVDETGDDSGGDPLPHADSQGNHSY